MWSRWKVGDASDGMVWEERVCWSSLAGAREYLATYGPYANAAVG